MCECGCTPHKAMCPSNGETRSDVVCSRCDDNILLGTGYYKLPDGYVICEDCLDDMTPRQVMENICDFKRRITE